MQTMTLHPRISGTAATVDVTVLAHKSMRAVRFGSNALPHALTVRYDA